VSTLRFCARVDGRRVKSAAAAAASPSAECNQTSFQPLIKTPTSKHQTQNSEARMKQEKRTPYSRHYALKGRGRKEQLRFENKGDRTELVPTRASVGM
jgi:hypothetical protein